LLDALVEEFATGGVGGRSLREVAEAVGTYSSLSSRTSSDAR
jgi:hypothetical protein